MIGTNTLMKTLGAGARPNSRALNWKCQSDFQEGGLSFCSAIHLGTTAQKALCKEFLHNSLHNIVKNTDAGVTPGYTSHQEQLHPINMSPSLLSYYNPIPLSPVNPALAHHSPQPHFIYPMSLGLILKYIPKGTCVMFVGFRISKRISSNFSALVFWGFRAGTRNT